MLVKTDRLVLTIIGSEDEAAVFETMDSRSVAEAVSFLQWPMTMEQASRWCRKSESGFKAGTDYLFIARGRQGRASVGCVGVHRAATPRTAEIGYWVAERAQGQGYATEMAGAAVKTAFDLGIDTLTATTSLHNTGSGRVLEKLGFCFSKLVDVELPDGAVRPSRLYAMSRR